MKRSYRQNCALAYGLDLVGERWTLLIVRELLIGPRRYGELLDNLVGIGTNLLAARLRDMEANGFVDKADDRYRLTDRGRLLEPVVAAIVRFGLALGKADDRSWLTRPEWDVVALRAVFDPQRAEKLEGRHVLELDGEPFTIDKHGDSVEIRHGDSASARSRARLSKPTARRLASGRLSLRDATQKGRVRITGSRRDATRMLAAFGIA